MQTQVIYKSVLLLTGEPFVLPPGAELIAAEDIDSIESTCTLPVLQDLECYTAVIGLASPDGNNSQVWEINVPGDNSFGGDVKLTGFRTTTSSVNSVFTPFASPYTFDATGISGGILSFKTEIQNKISALTSLQVVDTDGGSNYTIYITCKTTASVANTLFLVLTSVGEGLITSYIPFQKHSDLTGSGDLPTCS